MDSLTVKIYNKTFVSVPSDSNVVHNNVTINSVSYKYEAWAGLVLLFVFVVAYVLKKPMTITHTTNSAPTNVQVPYMFPADHTAGIRPYVPSTTANRQIDMSGLTDINITNEKL